MFALCDNSKPKRNTPPSLCFSFSFSFFFLFFFSDVLYFLLKPDIRLFMDSYTFFEIQSYTQVQKLNQWNYLSIRSLGRTRSSSRSTMCVVIIVVLWISFFVPPGNGSISSVCWDARLIIKKNCDNPCFKVTHVQKLNQWNYLSRSWGRTQPPTQAVVSD